MWGQILNATIETIYMVGVALVLSALFGIPLGILLVITGPRHIKPLPLIHRTLSIVINVGRSLPFIILLVAIIPFTRWLVGTSIGTAGAIVPLTVSAIPFMARVVESALLEVDWGVIEAAQAMGLRRADHYQGSHPRGGSRFSLRRDDGGGQLDQLLRDGRCGWRWWPGRFGDSLWISTFPGRHHVLYCSGVGGYGAKHTIFRRMVGEPVKPPLIKAKLKWRWI